MPSHRHPAPRSAASAVVCSVLCGCLSRMAATGGRERPAPSRPARSAAREGPGTLVALPPVVQPGRSPAAPPDSSQLVATFEPARPGRPVLLSATPAGGGAPSTARRQDRWGSAAFDVGPGTYRAAAGRAPPRRPAVTDRSVQTPALAHDLRGHLLRHDAGRLGLERPGAPARERLGAAHLRALRPGRPARGRRACCTSGSRSTRSSAGRPCSYVHPSGSGTHDYLALLPRSPPSSPASSGTASSPPASSSSGPGACTPRSGCSRRTAKFVRGDPSAGTEIDVMEYFGERRVRRRQHRLLHPLLRARTGCSV